MTYAACILWTFVLALWAAGDDAEQIRNNEKLNKALQWCVRAFGVTAFCVATGLWWMALPMGALFSSVFRFVLNRLRGLDWRYVSPSSWYDWQFLRITWFDGFFTKVQNPVEYHQQFYVPTGRNYQYQPAVHRAGLLAYIAEAVVIVGAVLIFA